MNSRRAGLFLLLLSGFIILLNSCRTWSSREEKAAQAYNEGNLYRVGGEYEKALSAYSEALEYEPGMSAATYNSALVLVEIDRSGEALESLQFLNQRDPRNLTVLRAMAWAAWKDGRIQASLDYYLSALLISPGDRDSLLGACEVYETSGRAAEAVEMRKLLFRIDNSTESHLFLIHTLLSAERFNEAMEHLRTVLIKTPLDIEILSSASYTAEKLGLYRESLNYLTMLSEVDGETGEVWWHLAELQLVHLGYYDEGITALKKALEKGFKNITSEEDLIARTPSAVRAAVRNILKAEL